MQQVPKGTPQRRPLERVVEKGPIEYAVISHIWDYVVLRAVVINSIRLQLLLPSEIQNAPKTPPYAELRAADDPYNALPGHIEPVYAHELVEDVAKGTLMLVNRLDAQLLAGSASDKFLRNFIPTIEMTHKQTGMDKLISATSGKRLRPHELFYTLEQIYPEMAKGFYRLLGGKETLDAFIKSQTANLAGLEEKLLELEAEHLVAQLLDKAYVATVEGLYSYMFSPLSQMLLGSKNPL